MPPKCLAEGPRKVVGLRTQLLHHLLQELFLYQVNSSPNSRAKQPKQTILVWRQSMRATCRMVHTLHSHTCEARNKGHRHNCKISYLKKILVHFHLYCHTTPECTLNSLREGTKKMERKGTLQQGWEVSLLPSPGQHGPHSEEAEEACSSPSKELLPH